MCYRCAQEAFLKEHLHTFRLSENPCSPWLDLLLQARNTFRLEGTRQITIQDSPFVKVTGTLATWQVRFTHPEAPLLRHGWLLQHLKWPR